MWARMEGPTPSFASLIGHLGEKEIPQVKWGETGLGKVPSLWLCADPSLPGSARAPSSHSQRLVREALGLELERLILALFPTHLLWAGLSAGASRRSSLFILVTSL